jgi:hypothetical protein
VPSEDARALAEERRRILHELDVERNQLLRNVETCRIRDLDRPLIGAWSIKDIVGHVASWEAEVISSLRDLRAGRRPALLDFDSATIDDWNEDHVERSRPLDFTAVARLLGGGRERLCDEFALISDEDLCTEGSIHNRLIRSLIDHDREHWHEIAARLAGMEGVRPTGPVSVPEETAYIT